MAGRRESPIQRARRWGAMAQALGLSLGLHVLLIAALGALAKRVRLTPVPTPPDQHDVVEVVPIEAPVPAETPGQPVTRLPPETDVPALPPGRDSVASLPSPAEPKHRSRPKTIVTPAPAPEAASAAAPDKQAAPAAAPGITREKPEKKPGIVAAEPVRVARAKAEPEVSKTEAAPAAPPDAGPAATATGAGTTADPSSGPSWGVVGVAPPGGSPLGLFVGLLNEKLREQWRAKEVYQRVDPRGRLGGSMFSTILDVRIRADGSLEQVAVRTSSGVPELDTEALEAFKRAQPLPHPPAGVLDGQGGYALQFGFHLDVAMFHFASQVQRTILEEWRGSPAFRQAGDHARKTLARLLLTKEGVLVHVVVLGSSGLDFLDEGIGKALQPGMRFPPPPPAFGHRPGLVPVDLEFLHYIHAPSGVHMLRPREVQEAKPEGKADNSPVPAPETK